METDGTSNRTVFRSSDNVHMSSCEASTDIVFSFMVRCSYSGSQILRRRRELNGVNEIRVSIRKETAVG
jgi:hypothetical protein